MLKVHFLNVGKGNCVVIKFPSGHLTVVDIDNSQIDEENDTLQDPIEFLNSNYPGESVFRFILTHPDMDHMSGLHELHKNRTIVNFWDIEHAKKVDVDKMGLGGYSKADWDTYQKLRSAKESPTVIRVLHDHIPKSYWKEDRIKILSPSAELIKHANKTEEYNHGSYVLMIEHEGIRVLLGGDATKEAWREILKNHGKAALKADVFLAPHHGSPDNVEMDVFKHIAPQYVVVSDHRGHSYDYSSYNSLAPEKVYSTKHYGNIELTVSKATKAFTAEKNI